MDEISKLWMERQLIARFAGSLERICLDREGPLEVDQETTELAMLFLRDFLLPHHRAEELLVYRQLELRGLPAGFGPLASLRLEHEEIRLRTARLARVLDRTGRQQDWNGLYFAKRLERIATLVRAHTRHEIRFLQMVRSGVDVRFATVSQDCCLEGTIHPWLEILRELEHRIAYLGSSWKSSRRMTSMSAPPLAAPA